MSERLKNLFRDDDGLRSLGGGPCGAEVEIEVEIVPGRFRRSCGLRRNGRLGGRGCYPG